MGKPNLTGSTFAERAAAAAGRGSFTDPTPKPEDVGENSTFAGRATAKAVSGSGAENKAVASSEAKGRSAKKS